MALSASESLIWMQKLRQIEIVIEASGLGHAIRICRGKQAVDGLRDNIQKP